MVQFSPENLTSGCNNFDDIPQNKITEFHGEFPSFIHAEFGHIKVINPDCVIVFVSCCILT